MVKWKRLRVEDATWENMEELQDRFVTMDLEDKDSIKEGVTDRPRRRSQLAPSKESEAHGLRSGFCGLLNYYWKNWSITG